MATTRITVSDTEWTALGAGPITVGMDRGDVHFDTGPTAPTDARSGYHHAAQGQMRLVNFAKSETVWARATQEGTKVVVVAGALASTGTPSPESAVYLRYADLPDPSTVEVGTEAVVTADPQDALNGKHIALGDTIGGMAAYWVEL